MNEINSEVIPACLPRRNEVKTGPESDFTDSGLVPLARVTTPKKKKIIKNKEKGIQKIRFIVQTLFALLCIWIGVEFYQFTQYLETNGSTAFTSRPPGVDGFLPISSFMSFYLFLMTGQIHSAHPAGFFIFFAIILVSIVFGKAFCSWLCPVGFLSELIGDFGKKIFKKDLKLPKFLDYPTSQYKISVARFSFLFGFLFDEHNCSASIP